MKAKVVTLGELTLRLSPFDFERFVQADSFEVIFGGAEANVAIALSNLGDNVTYVTKLVDNE
ncbi:MAG: PfkB family carbohydrate kinase, partial [Peptoniphilaceae bacterium]|nr:PfkB family carbohydrate kinase [Peptoniphilaceae bacterium]